MTLLPPPQVETARPENLADARDLMVGTDPDQALLLRGAGTKLDWGASPERVDLVVDAGGLDTVVAHNERDFTLAVGAGMPLGRLQQQLAEYGQWLAVDPPGVEDGATVGGIMAANDAGPRRLRYGSMRDLVIGATVVLADGSVARAGGHVIKNVAGYDLAKLMVGSLGTLGLLVEVVFRLHPLPGNSTTVRIAADPAQATAASLAVLAAPVEPAAMDWAEAEDGGALWVRIQGHEAAVGDQAQVVMDLARERGLEPQRLADNDDADVWRRLTEATGGTDGDTVARANTLPSQFVDAAAALRRAAHETGVALDAEAPGADGATATLSSHTGLGLHTVRIRGGDARAHATLVATWRRELAAAVADAPGSGPSRGGASVVLRRRAEGVEELVDAWGPEPTGIAVMRRVKESLDPARRLAPGRMVGGL